MKVVSGFRNVWLTSITRHQINSPRERKILWKSSLRFWDHWFCKNTKINLLMNLQSIFMEELWKNDENCGNSKSCQRHIVNVSATTATAISTSMGAIRWGTCPPHFFRQWGYNMPCSPHFLFRFFNILVSHQPVPLTFYNKIALMSTSVIEELLQKYTAVI